MYICINKFLGMHCLLFLFFWGLFGVTGEQEVEGSEVAQAYIAKYKEIAISEMSRTKIPASIKLAQGILESGHGTSSLSVKANNHFGIKCHKDWKGKTYYHKDDDYKNGKLIKSCFRKFDSPEESWIEHSEFLVKGSRYDFLFEYKQTEYKKWAKGLQKAGYATAKTYSSRLISIIEKYQLYQYDKMRPCNIDKSCRIKETASTGNKTDGVDELGKDRVYIHNDIKMIFVNNKQTIYDISKTHGITLKRLRQYNDMDHFNWEIEDGSRIYLQPKRSGYRGKKKYHVVQPDETLMSISQYYGIRVDKLAKKNGISMKDSPVAGERIVIRGKNKRTVRVEKTKKATYKPINEDAPVKSDYKIVKEKGDEYIDFDGEDEVAPKKVLKSSVSTPKPVKTISGNKVVQHEVIQGQTLWSISRMYNVSVDQIKTWNNLGDAAISIGQMLFIEQPK